MWSNVWTVKWVNVLFATGSRRRYLIEQGAQVGAVNSEGELPLDVATEDAMERLLKGEIKKQGRKTAMDPAHRFPLQVMQMFQRL